ncbi:hypothetical protein NPIL_351381, partial [Nephila pilipes]
PGKCNSPSEKGLEYKIILRRRRLLERLEQPTACQAAFIGIFKAKRNSSCK